MRVGSWLGGVGAVTMAAAMGAGCSAGGGEPVAQPKVVRAAVHPGGDEAKPRFERPPAAELRARLTPLQWAVTQESATERPFENEFHAHREPGIYVDVVSGEPLFSSLDKFDSGCGWPAFAKPLGGTEIAKIEDRSHGMSRIEVRSRGADSHLGHVFDDGPVALGGQRFCINSAALRFVPLAAMAAQGYQQHLQPFVDAGLYDAEGGQPTAPATETATFAGGCFWGMEELLRNLPGVVSTEVGYTGGDVEHPRYEQVKGGRTGHAEAVRIVFNPKQIGYADLLRWFFRMHDPTTPNRQGNDVGTQYRSVIFVHSDAQRAAAEQAKAEAGASGRWKRPVVTAIEDAGAWWSAEDYHQDYLQANPGGYTCHWIRD